MNRLGIPRALDFLVCSHSYIYGSTDMLVNYLGKREAGRVLALLHDIPNVDPTWSGKDLTYLQEYREGILVDKRTLRTGGPEMLHYFRQLVLTMYLAVEKYWARRKSFDVFVGVDSFNAVLGLILRRMRLVKKVVFYSHSHLSPYPGGFLKNSTYQLLERLCSQKSDVVWNLSETLTEYRRKNYDISSDRCITVETGLEIRPSLQSETGPRTEEFRLVFVGHLSERAGLSLVIESLRYILERIPKLLLIVIGGGPLCDLLQTQARGLGLQDRVQFLGPLAYTDVLRTVEACDIGLAPYPEISRPALASTDPMKIKIYLASGLPVITTGVASIASEIVSRNAGVVISFDTRSFANAVLEVLSNLESFKRNARKLAENHHLWDTNQIFDTAFNSSSTFLIQH